jgi:hypothetical protein
MATHDTFYIIPYIATEFIRILERVLVMVLDGTFHNNLMKLGGSLGNVPQKNLENGPTVRNIWSFYNKFFIFLWNVT